MADIPQWAEALERQGAGRWDPQSRTFWYGENQLGRVPSVGSGFQQPTVGAPTMGAPTVGGSPFTSSPGIPSVPATSTTTSTPATGGGWNLADGFGWDDVLGGLKNVGGWALNNPELILGGLSLWEGYNANKDAAKLTDRALGLAQASYDSKAGLRDAAMGRLAGGGAQRDMSFARDTSNPYALPSVGAGAGPTPATPGTPTTPATPTTPGTSAPTTSDPRRRVPSVGRHGPLRPEDIR